MPFIRLRKFFSIPNFIRCVVVVVVFKSLNSAGFCQLFFSASIEIIIYFVLYSINTVYCVVELL